MDNVSVHCPSCAGIAFEPYDGKTRRCVCSMPIPLDAKLVRPTCPECGVDHLIYWRTETIKVLCKACNKVFKRPGNLPPAVEMDPVAQISAIVSDAIMKIGSTVVDYCEASFTHVPSGKKLIVHIQVADRPTPNEKLLLMEKIARKLADGILQIGSVVDLNTTTLAIEARAILDKL